MSSLPRKVIYSGAISTVLIAVVLGLVLFAKASTYTIFIDGNPVTIEGHYDTVAEIVAAARISLRPDDLIFPDQGQPANPETAITIEHAVPVSLHIVTDSSLGDDGEDNERIFYTHQTYLEQFLIEIGHWLSPGDEVVVDGRVLTREELGKTPVPEKVEIYRLRAVTIHDDGPDRKFKTAVDTVGEALLAENIRLFTADTVTPSLRTPLSPTTEITISRSKPVTVKVDGRLEHTRSQAEKVLELLAEVNVVLHNLDYTIPEADTALNDGDVVEVIRVSQEVTHTDEIIPYDSLSQLTAELELDQRAIIQAGSPGILRRSTIVEYENGIAVSREPTGETILQAPVNEVIGIGTKVVVRTLDTPDGPMEYWRVVRMRVTAYTAATSGKDPSHPAYGITASGVPAGYGVVAVDPNVVPFRSYVYVPGYGRAFAGDTGGGVKGRFIDLGYNEGEIVAWNGYVDVYYLTPVPPADEINYFLPTYLP